MDVTPIRIAREAKGWSQAKLAEAAGTHQPVISDLESGRKVNPKIATLQRIVSAVGLRIELRPVETPVNPEEAANAA